MGARPSEVAAIGPACRPRRVHGRACRRRGARRVRAHLPRDRHARGVRPEPGVPRRVPGVRAPGCREDAARERTRRCPGWCVHGAGGGRSGDLAVRGVPRVGPRGPRQLPARVGGDSDQPRARHGELRHVGHRRTRCRDVQGRIRRRGAGVHRGVGAGDRSAGVRRVPRGAGCHQVPRAIRPNPGGETPADRRLGSRCVRRPPAAAGRCAREGSTRRSPRRERAARGTATRHPRRSAAGRPP